MIGADTGLEECEIDPLHTVVPVHERLVRETQKTPLAKRRGDPEDHKLLAPFGEVLYVGVHPHDGFLGVPFPFLEFCTARAAQVPCST